jgi:rhodanese-related sulfurtransferase
MNTSVRLAGVAAEHLAAWLGERAPVRVLDLRPLSSYDGGHIDGAEHVPPSKPVSILDRLALDGLTVLVCEDGRHSMQVAKVLGDCGMTTVTWLDGGMRTWAETASKRLRPRAISVQELKDRIDHVRIIDVRDAGEFREGRIPGSVNVPLDEGSSDDLIAAAQGHVVIVSGSGRRAELAQKRLAAAGIEADVLSGGIASWALSRGATVERRAVGAKAFWIAAAMLAAGAVMLAML